jgi:hypothetical protein
MTLFQNIDDLIESGFVNKLSKYTDDNLGDQTKAVKGIFFSLIAGLVRRSNSVMSSNLLYNQILSQSKIVDNFGTNILSIIDKKENVSQLSDKGSRIISQIFPAFKSPLISMISSYAGTSKNSTVLLLGVSSSVLIKLLGEKIQENKLDAEGLVDYIKLHHEPLFQNAPDGLLEKMIPALGLHELSNMKMTIHKKNESAQIKSVETPSHTEVVEDNRLDYDDLNRKPKGINIKVILYILGVVLIGALVYFGLQNQDMIFGDKADENESVVMEGDSISVGDTSLSVVDTTASALTQPSDSLKIATELDELNSLLSAESLDISKEIFLSSIPFTESSFDYPSNGQEIAEGLGSMMNANPNLEIKISGYDQLNDVKTMTKRAFAMKKELLKKGINGIRIDAVPGGKGKNVISVKIVKK